MQAANAACADVTKDDPEISGACWRLLGGAAKLTISYKVVAVLSAVLGSVNKHVYGVLGWHTIAQLGL